jgi:hypothetical protein
MTDEIIHRYVLDEEKAQHIHEPKDWVVGLVINVGDIIRNDGVSFLAYVAHTATAEDEPILPMAAGAQGPAGPQGAVGPTGPVGPAGGEIGHWAIEEVPSGARNGINQTYTLAHTPTGGVQCFYGSDGSCARMVYGVAFSVADKIVTLITFAPNDADGDNFFVTYPYDT